MFPVDSVLDPVAVLAFDFESGSWMQIGKCFMSILSIHSHMGVDQTAK